MNKLKLDIINEMIRASIQTWTVRTVAVIAFFNGLFTIYRPLAERIPERIEGLLTPLNIDYAARSVDLFLGITLIYYSFRLLQRKLTAWWVALLILSVLSGLHLAVSHSLQSAVIPMISLGALILTKPYFKSKTELNSIGRGLLIFLTSFLVAILYGTIGFAFMHRRDFGINFSFADSLMRSAKAFLLIGNPDLVARTRYARWFLDSLAIMGLSGLFYGLYSLFKPIAYKLETLPSELAHTEELLNHHSRSSDDFFKIWPHDKSYYFGDENKSVIAYGVRAGVALCVGDPVGETKSVEKLIKDFDEQCLINGWSPAYIYINEDFLKAYKELGYDVLKIGEDAVVNLKTFIETTVNDKHFRNIKNRFAKDGFQLEFSKPPHPKQLIDETSAISRAWLSGEDRKEWKFLAGHYGRRYINDTNLFIARNAEGTALAFANQVPCYINGWATVDLMRSRKSAPKNTMDFMLMSVMENLREKGYQKFNLGLAPLSGLGEASEPEEKLLDLIYRSNQRFISFKGLRQFKGKFEPDWQPKYIAYKGGPARLPRVAYSLTAMLRADKA